MGDEDCPHGVVDALDVGDARDVVPGLPEKHERAHTRLSAMAAMKWLVIASTRPLLCAINCNCGATAMQSRSNPANQVASKSGLLFISPCMMKAVTMHAPRTTGTIGSLALSSSRRFAVDPSEYATASNQITRKSEQTSVAWKTKSPVASTGR